MNLSRLFASRVAAAALCLTALDVVPAHAALDLDGNGVPDIWGLAYELPALDMNADSDGDGESNADEAIAGTNPLRPDASIKVSQIGIDIYGLHVTLQSESGKRYQLQSAGALDSPVWTDVGDPAGGTGGELIITADPAGATEKFYRVKVQDLDSDNDGITDWEELQIGFNPNDSHSGGPEDPDDLAAVTAALAAPSVVSISATDPLGTEPATGSPATDTALFTIKRTGGLKKITVNLAWSGAATLNTDYTPGATSVTLPLGIHSATVTATPLADGAGTPVVESPESVLLTVSAGTGYTTGGQTTAGAIINDFISANGTGLRAEFFNEANTLHTGGVIPPGVAPTFANRIVTRIDTAIDYDWLSGTTQGVHSPAAGVNVDYFASRWSGEILPEFSQIYTFELEHNRCARLWVNGQLLINRWPGNGDNTGGANRANDNPSATTTATIELTAGIRYPILIEHFDTTGDGEMHVRWSSANQVKQVIPTLRMFPDTAPQITSAREVLLIKDSGPYAYQIAASGKPTTYGATNLPPGWTINTSTGLINGSPTEAGIWDVILSATNANGTGNAIFTITVIGTGGAITRDLWTGLPGTSVATLPLGSTPTSTGTLTLLEGPQDAADDYGARIRGYVTAPASGIYKFFLTASNAAELYVSDDDDPVNIFKRAQVASPTGYREWTNPAAGKSPLLWLEAGRRYYVEVRHKAGVGADHVSVGWLKPGQGLPDPSNVTTPSEVVPTYALSPYVVPTASPGESTLFTASMSSQGGAVTSGYGAASLRLSADETQATLVFSYANLNSAVAAKHIHSDDHNGAIIFDIDTATPNMDGSYTWDIVAAGAITTSEIIDTIKGGQSYINIHTATSPQGEIRGNFRLTAASQIFTPPAAQTWSDPNSANNVESALSPLGAARFLVQSTYGVHGRDADVDGTADAIEEVQSLGFEGWIDNEFAKSSSPLFPHVFANRVQTDSGSPTYPGTLLFNSWWRRAVTAPDQLRQRVAFALSEIVVTSEDGPLDDRAEALSTYYDVLLDGAFGNFRDLLETVTLHPAMGRYLDMLNNRKPNLSIGRIPNENYAREILQLFSIGLNRMHPDGSLILNSKGEIVPTYDQDVVVGFSHAFTGWTYHYTDTLIGEDPATYRTSNTGTANWTQLMQPVPLEHFTGQKRLLNNVVLPGLPVVQGQPLDPYATHGATQYNDPVYKALVRQELDATHDAIFNHPNTGPFICRQLIQRLITGTPSRGYLYRVVQKFNDNGAGVRGDMKAVIKAILLDYEARSTAAANAQGFGKQREPVVRVTSIARGFPAPVPVSGDYTQTGNLITVTTDAPHLYANGQTVYLEFTTGVPSAPDAGPYTVTVTGPSAFTCRPLTSETATYAQVDATITVTIPGDHTYNVGNSVYIDFTSGAPTAPNDGFYSVVTVDPNDIFFTVRPLTAVAGTYSQVGSVITVSAAGHAFGAGSSVYLDFTSGTPDSAVDGLFTVVDSTPGTTFTVTAPDAIDRTGNVFATPSADVVSRTGNATTTRAAYVVDRTGEISVTYSDWNMDTTGSGALTQTPMRSPTVFNFFLPDYQFPGRLGQAGLITPEFEITSETTVIDQANFLYSGLYSEFNSIRGLSSFKGGGRDVVLDYRPWMGTGPGAQPWAHNNNLLALIDKISQQLMGATLPAGIRTRIQTHVQSLGYTTPTPTESQLRDRVRAVIHLIVTSPQFTVQK